MVQLPGALYVLLLLLVPTAEYKLPCPYPPVPCIARHVGVGVKAVVL